MNQIMEAHNTAYDLQTADAVLLLEAPRREAPDVCDTSRPIYSYGLILVLPVVLIVAAFTLLTRLTPTLFALPRW